MTTQRSITELSALIDKNTKLLEEATRGQPGSDFSFALSLPPSPPMKLDASLEAVRDEALEAADELKARLLGPFLYMGSLALPTPAIIIILNSLYHFDIASHVPVTPGASITYSDLAKRVNMPLDDLQRVLQTAIAYRFFEEDVPDVSVRHNAVSALFALIPGMKDALNLIAEDNPNGARRFVESVRKYPGSGEPGHAPLMVSERREKGVEVEAEIADPSKGFFDFIKDDKPRLERFRNTMGTMTSAPGYGVEYFLDNVPWGAGAKCPQTIVDIGGAGGDLCKKILRRFPEVRKATSVDLPEVLATVEIPNELKERLAFGKYDFLQEKMSYEADAYVFRHIFHDWSDQYAVKIFKNLAAGLSEGKSTRVWINEVVLPSLSDRNHLEDQRQRTADLLMKIGFNGKERSRGGWEAVLAEADPRFRIENIIQPEGATDAVIEVVFG